MCWIMEKALLKNRQGLPSFLGPELCYRHWEAQGAWVWVLLLLFSGCVTPYPLLTSLCLGFLIC